MTCIKPATLAAEELVGQAQQTEMVELCVHASGLQHTRTVTRILDISLSIALAFASEKNIISYPGGQTSSQPVSRWKHH